MEIVKYNIEKIMAEIEYKYIQKYSDNQLNSFLIIGMFLMKKKKKFRN